MVVDDKFCAHTTVYPAVVSTPTEDQVCLSDEQRQIVLNRIHDDVHSILGSSNSTTFATGN